MSGSSRKVSRTAPPRGPSRSARRSARSSTSRPRATLISQAPGFIPARAASSIIPSVAGVSGAARTTKSESARRSARPSGPVTRSSIRSDQRRLAVGGEAGPCVDRPRSASSRAVLRAGSPAGRDDPAAEGGREGADRPPDRAEADDAHGHVAQLGALERLPGPLALELEELGQAPADGQDHHHHVLGDRPAEDAPGVGHDQPAVPAGRGQDPLDAGRGGVDPGESRGVGEEPVEGLGREEAPQEDLDVVERPVGEALDRDRHEPGPRRGRPDPLEVARPGSGPTGSG